MFEDSDDGDCRSAPTDASPPPAGNAGKQDYEVGYRKPPKATQFQKGRSGNPKGAKKKAAIDDVRIMVEDVLAAPVTLRDGEKELKVTRMEAMLRKQRLNALKGDSKAAKAMFKLSQKAGMFSQAKRRSNIVIDPAGSTPEERMMLRAFRAEQDSQSLDRPADTDNGGTDGNRS